jgi:hypothetical protein
VLSNLQSSPSAVYVDAGGGVQTVSGAVTVADAGGEPVTIKDEPMHGMTGSEFVNEILAGHRLVDVEVRGPVQAESLRVSPPVQLESVRFTDRVLMPFARFEGPFMCAGCRFEGGAIFLSASFNERADFFRNPFQQRRLFLARPVLGEALFQNIVVDTKGEALGNIDAGEFNLSWAHFRQKADFYRARLHGPFRLYRTLFFSDVVMEEMLFGALAEFTGRVHDVSIDLLGIEPNNVSSLFNTLEQADLVSRDEEVRTGQYPRFVHPKASSEEEWERRLRSISLSENQRKGLIEAFREQARGMFVPGTSTSLQRIEIPGAAAAFGYGHARGQAAGHPARHCEAFQRDLAGEAHRRRQRSAQHHRRRAGHLRGTLSIAAALNRSRHRLRKPKR